jgi:hypothetical protein
MRAGDQVRIGVLLRKAQWLLDDSAYYIMRDELGHADYTRVANALDEVSTLLRARAESSGDTAGRASDDSANMETAQRDE